jgi:TonB family protein
VSIILQGTAVKRVEPAYPKLAVEIRTGGPVVVEVVVDETGKVISARSLSGHALLRKAAEDAARGWRWNPTRLNGVAVQVVGTITFNFVL